MKIVHISDVHIRNLKYHVEYRRVFENFYRELDRIKPDLVVNTGDTAHTKTHISPEYVELCSEFIGRIADYAEEHIILGNHDLNLVNLERQDAISPIVENLGRKNVFLHKRSGCFAVRPGLNFWIFSLADRERFPTRDDWSMFPGDVNVGLFHGSVENCLTDMNWRMRDVEIDLGSFDGLDYVLLGDIHKQQFFRERKIAYAGSMIQQNFGEELDKGFLLWEIYGKDTHRVSSVYLEGSRKFYTVKLDPDLSLPTAEILPDSRLRIVPPRVLTLTEQKEVQRVVKKACSPHDVIVLAATSVGGQEASVGKKKIATERIGSRDVQERLLRDFLIERKTDEKMVERVVELDSRYQIVLDQEEGSVHDVEWSIDKIAWSNFFNYGEGNVLNFERIPGLTGLFAPNGSGKSNLIDVLLEACFDNITKGVSKNVCIINDNKDVASTVVELTANGQKYIIERSVERIKYGQKKFGETREWGKTTTGFYSADEFDERVPLMGDSRPETERNIRQRLGTFDDFMLTSLSAQWNPSDVISCKETKRREILYRFLGLDVPEKKLALAKKDSSGQIALLKSIDEAELEKSISELKFSVDSLRKSIEENERLRNDLVSVVKFKDDMILGLVSQKVSIDLPSELVGYDRLQKIDEEICSLDEKIVQEGEAIGRKAADVTRIKEDVASFDFRFHEEKKEERDEAQKKITRLERQLGREEDALVDCDERVSTLDEVPCGDAFPTCKFLVDAFASKSRLEPLRKTIEDLKRELLELRSKERELAVHSTILSENANRRGLIVDFTRELDGQRLRLENIQLKRSGLAIERERVVDAIARREKAADNLAHNRELDATIIELQNERDEKNQEVVRIQKNITELTRLLGSNQGTLEKMETQLVEIREARDLCVAHELYAAAMGKDGIPYRILTEKLPLINEEINKILANSADFGVFIEDDPEEQSVRFYLQYGQYKSRLLELGSGAEKMLASVAIRAGLLSISNLPKPNMFVIDEGFGKLDPEHLENVQRMFDYLKTVFDHVIVVSHLDVMKDFVDNQIEITTDDEGYAHVEI